MINKKKAFTLAEVLIALTIIGVVSALTIPTLVQKTNKQEYVTALKKAHSVLSQAAQMVIAEEGSPKGEGGWAVNENTVFELFKKKLNNIKDCGNAANQKCFSDKYKLLSGGAARDFDGAAYPKLILADGASMLVQWASTSCSEQDDGTSNVCAAFYVDINGIKGPNTVGRDIFSFMLKEDKLVPSGCEPELAPSDACESGKSGWSCACKVLREGKMDY